MARWPRREVGVTTWRGPDGPPWCERQALLGNARFGYRTLETPEVVVQTAKQEVQELLQELPEDATLEDIQYHIYVKQKIAQGLADVPAGRVVSQEEVEKRFARWLEK